MISVTLLGHAAHGVITRARAQLGDDVYVTGTLGDAALGLRMLEEGRDDAAARAMKERFLSPTARIVVGQEIAARSLATAMIDVSDGLLQDLGHLCEESGVGAVVKAATLPLSPEYRYLVGEQEKSLALTGGDDYELLFAAAAEYRSAVTALAHDTGCRITRIGCIVAQSEGLSVRNPDGSVYTPAQAGYDHFRRG
jgi:thiamine-monophosphate kinase